MLIGNISKGERELRMLGVESNYRIILRYLKGYSVLGLHFTELHRPGEKNITSVSTLSREGMLATKILESAHVDWQLSRNSRTLCSSA